MITKYDNPPTRANSYNIIAKPQCYYLDNKCHQNTHNYNQTHTIIIMILSLYIIFLAVDTKIMQQWKITH